MVPSTSRRTLWAVAFAAASLALGAGCGQDSGEVLTVASGGDLSIVDRTSHAFTKPAPNLNADELELHLEGDLAFEAQFVSPGAPRNAGLGPGFNNNACAACHIRNGRGMPVVGHPSLRSSMLVRVSLPEGEPLVPGGAVPVGELGVQLQDHAIGGAEPEVSIDLQWERVPGSYADGTPYELRRPKMTILLADGTELPDEVQRSLRQSPPIVGLGLLEAVPEATILAMADPDDADGDGISGRPNRVWDARAQRAVLGRFGHKANEPNLTQQTADAFVNDMGVLTPYGDGAHAEIDAAFFEATVFYTQSLAIPERFVPAEPERREAIARGEVLFEELNCVGCHVSELESGPADYPSLAHQRFAPYTDLLLHDMGEELADGRPDFEATGREWRTAPLWGLGLAQTVLPGSGYLHDGRARTIAEAILWHGGEAEASREGFRHLSKAERDDLLAFLRSL